MADVTINSLDPIDRLENPDLLVVWDQSSNTAKNMSGQQMVARLTELADGHGGIQGIAKTSTSGLVDTYTITYADGTVGTFTVTNGAKGDTGDQTYVWIKWAAQNPTADNQLSNNPDKWIGIYTGTASTAPTTRTSYKWYEYKGEKGDQGDAISSVVKTSGTGEPGTTDTYTMYVGSTAIGTFDVYNGLNGTGAVNTVNNILPDSSGNVSLTATDVGAASFTDTTNGYWKIRLWANGTVEAWYSHAESFACTNPYGGFYINGVSTVVVSIPNIFSTVELCNVSGYSGTNGYAGMIAFTATVSGSIPILCMSTGTGTISATVNVYMRGTSA